MLTGRLCQMSEISEKWEKNLKLIEAVKKEIAKAVIGQEDVIQLMLTALISKGHCLITGVPGLAKTLLVSTAGKILGLKFHRIQFTPDMMPSDIIGSEILQTTEHGRKFEFTRGPVFANLILADEINRTPPKTQAALLEAMQEKQVTVAGKTFPLEEPFLVFATQNPIEHEGTYPLPEAQLDRFFFHINITYPAMEEEKQIIKLTTGKEMPLPMPVLNRDDVLEIQNIASEIPVPDHTLEYILKIVGATRPDSPSASEYVKKYVAWGAGPRASQNLTKGAKSLALLKMQAAVSNEEIKELVKPVLRHRIIPNYNAIGEGISVEKIIEHIMETVK
jgi:MoxR-like ATPase